MKFKTFLDFKEVPTKPDRRTKIFDVTSRATGAFLGRIEWKSTWRTYVFFPFADTLFDVKCLKELTVFIDQLIQERKSQGFEEFQISVNN